MLCSVQDKPILLHTCTGFAGKAGHAPLTVHDLVDTEARVEGELEHYR